MEGHRGQCGRGCAVSDTPRTDACWDNENCNILIHARQLERELAEVTKQRDALIEGLEKIASCDWVITLPDRMDAVRKIAKQTLNKLKP